MRYSFHDSYADLFCFFNWSGSGILQLDLPGFLCGLQTKLSPPECLCGTGGLLCSHDNLEVDCVSFICPCLFLLQFLLLCDLLLHLFEGILGFRFLTFHLILCLSDANSRSLNSKFLNSSLDHLIFFHSSVDIIIFLIFLFHDLLICRFGCFYHRLCLYN